MRHSQQPKAQSKWIDISRLPRDLESPILWPAQPIDFQNLLGWLLGIYGKESTSCIGFSPSILGGSVQQWVWHSSQMNNSGLSPQEPPNDQTGNTDFVTRFLQKCCRTLQNFLRWSATVICRTGVTPGDPLDSPCGCLPSVQQLRTTTTHHLDHEATNHLNQYEPLTIVILATYPWNTHIDWQWTTNQN